jgi:tetratricopeptide (TPR) repeat protein
VRLLGAASAGLAASALHSLVDFVWYIPACMSITIILAGCALRLSQLATPAEGRAKCYRTSKRGRWIERTAGAALIGVWAIHTYVGPGVAAVYWDRYLRTSVANTALSEQQVEAMVDNQPALQSVEQSRLNDAMIEELDNVLRWDPHCARAHLRLAARYIAQFDLLQQQSENAMNLAQIRDAMATGSFVSSDQQYAWLQRVFGANLGWLQRADAEARIAASLCPLQGEAYVYLAQLAFLHRGSLAETNAYVDQGLRVRPHDAGVLFEVGRQDFIAGNVDAAIAHWRQCFADPGTHQLKIVYLLAGRLNAASFLETFQPDWRILRAVWSRYHDLGKPEDTDALLTYSANCAGHETREENNIPKELIWFFQAQFYTEAGRADDGLKCLERAYTLGPRRFFIRRALAQSLQAAGRFAEAEPHYRWCLARRPEDKSLSAALVEISKQRLAQRQQQFEAAQQARLATGIVPVSAETVSSSQSPPAPSALPTAAGTTQLQVAGPASTAAPLPK